MTTRRQLLAGIGAAGLAGVAGCSGLPFASDGGNDPPDVTLSTEMLDAIQWPPSPFPATVPSSLGKRHRERTRALLASVPDRPSIPNQAVAERIRSHRHDIATDLGETLENPWPLDRLDSLRYRRHEAAAVRAAYRAATGTDDAATINDRRRQVRADLASFVATHEYRATGPLNAVLRHAPIENLIEECRHNVRPNPGYPADPLADPFQAGDAVGRVEGAAAAIADASRLRDLSLAIEETASQWSTLLMATERLSRGVYETRDTVSSYLDADDSPFDGDLEGTAGKFLYERATEEVRQFDDGFESERRDGHVAKAVVRAGRTLAAVEALRAAITGLNDGSYQATVTADSVAQAADRARSAIEAIGGQDNAGLATLLVEPALHEYAFADESIKEGYADPTRLQGDFAWMELYARAVPAATTFVAERLTTEE